MAPGVRPYKRYCYFKQTKTRGGHLEAKPMLLSALLCFPNPILFLSGDCVFNRRENKKLGVRRSIIISTSSLSLDLKSWPI